MSKKKSFGAQPWTYPQPVFLVGTYDVDGKANVMTAAWGGIVSSDPVSVAVSIRPARWTYEAIVRTKSFTISMPDVSKMAEADYIGIVSGRRYDKFQVTKMTYARAEKVDAPYVVECPVVLECSVSNTLDVGSHLLLIGKVEDTKVDEAILDVTGTFPDPEKFTPLAFAAGSGTYHALSPVLGKAFSVGKIFLK